MKKNLCWMQFKNAMELQNQASRANLRLKNSIIRDLKSVIPEKEKTDSCCVVVSLSEIRAVRSLSPSDYMVKTQVELIWVAVRPRKCRLLSRSWLRPERFPMGIEFCLSAVLSGLFLGDIPDPRPVPPKLGKYPSRI